MKHWKGHSSWAFLHFSIVVTNPPKLLLNGFIKVATNTDVGSKSHLLEGLEEILLIWMGTALGRQRDCCSGKHIAQCLLTGNDFAARAFWTRCMKSINECDAGKSFSLNMVTQKWFCCVSFCGFSEVLFKGMNSLFAVCTNCILPGGKVCQQSNPSKVPLMVAGRGSKQVRESS